MRAALSALLILLGSHAASAEVWITREGECGDWRGRWEVEQQSDGIWVGTINYRHLGGPCVSGSDEQFRSDVRATIEGDTLFAFRRDDNGQFCGYYGRVQENRIRGVALCELGRRSPFALSFRAGRPDQRQEDNWLDDPRRFDRNEPIPGIDRNFRR